MALLGDTPRMHHASVTALNIFPVKSCAPIPVFRACAQARGFIGDRRWMVTDAAGHCLTARKHPSMVLIRATPTETSLLLRAPSMRELRVDVPCEGPTIVVSIWSSAVAAMPADNEAAAWISQYLGLPARLVYMPDDALRAVDSAYGRDGDIVSFADGFPMLLISQASLDALNARLAEPVPMLRFRPSIVVAGTAPHAEDQWRCVRIGDVMFDVVKPCTRCVLTTVDLERGAFDPQLEPLRTLSTYRRTSLGVEFGQNLIPRGSGLIDIGAAIEIVA